MTSPKNANLQHEVYAAYSAEGVLLYVGCARDVVRRVEEHHEVNPWWTEVREVRVLATRPTRDEGEAMERHFIATLHPRYNQVRFSPKEQWTLADYLGAIAGYAKRYPGSPFRKRDHQYMAAIQERFGVNLPNGHAQALTEIARLLATA